MIVFTDFSLTQRLSKTHMKPNVALIKAACE